MLRSPDRTTPRWSREQIRAARLAPLLPLLEKRGLALVETGGGNFAVRQYAGLIVKDGYWRWPDRDLAGNAIPPGSEHLSRGEATRKVMEELSNPLVTGLRELPMPVVSALPGVVAGAGIGLALAADVVIAARSAYFYLPFIPKLGIVPDLGTTWFLEKLLADGGTLDQLVSLGETLEHIKPRLEQLADVVPQLASAADTLGRAATPLGDLAGRIPGGRRRTQQAAAAAESEA